MKNIGLLVLGGALVLAGCEQGGAGASATAAPAAVAPVATVNGTAISRDMYEFYVKNATGKPPAELSAEQRDQALDALVRAEIVAQQAVKEGIDKDAETAHVLALSRIELLQRAKQQRFLKDKVPTEQELRAEYETQVAALPKLEYRARHILVATEDFAKRMIAQLDKGANFAQLATRESMDNSKSQGGDLGWFTPDRMVKPFAEAVVALQKGQHTKTAVQTQYGWHVIQLEDTREVAAPPYDEVKERLGQIVLQKQFKTYTDELLKTAKVEKKL
jgi:peptidyl-prolyl cis-trans isomerase C